MQVLGNPHLYIAGATVLLIPVCELDLEKGFSMRPVTYVLGHQRLLSNRGTLLGSCLCS